jgi:hypothetical protein
MDWTCGLRSRVPALQTKSLEFKPYLAKKKKKKKRTRLSTCQESLINES